MKNYKFLITLFLGLSLLASSCGEKQDNSLEGKKAKLQELQSQLGKTQNEIAALQKEISVMEPDTTEKVTYVKAMPIVTEDFSHYVEANGKLEAENNVFVSPQTGGAITQVLVKEGDFVKKDQVVARIDDSILKNNINEVKTQLETARTLFGRQKALWDQKIGTEVQYIQSKSQVESLEKRLATLNSQLAQSEVKSPLSGYVDEVRLKAGEIASPGMGILRVVNLNILKVVSKIPDTYAGTIKKGDLVKVQFPDLNKEIDSRLSFVSQTVDPVTRTFAAEAKVPINRDFKPNLNAVVFIKDQSKAETIAISENLVQNTERGQIVYVAEEQNGKQVARGREVSLGLSYNGKVEVLTGLSAGDVLITDGYQDLVDGEVVSF
ncbi:efflux RND transporter periplasmic adaptor subunit [Marinilongibacter aquaticus]|uniref:efflux RND transporter periplasmic adaptor subunit n=1 Tax=Marinilongibacter aquaticus TaxID=2975157 RepID=UPI0021BDB04F|nr:efflux RND transporter periplasmic adaptor subunit [Marinilongibacter aquaticus]UBM57830.1 efflux RND transporter periplasmic adaptor subunit [Marinilongibacter aquaticus]